MTTKIVFLPDSGKPNTIFVHPGEYTEDPRLRTLKGEQCRVFDDGGWVWISLPEKSTDEVLHVVDVFSDFDIQAEQGPKFFSFDPALVKSIEHRPDHVEGW